MEPTPAQQQEALRQQIIDLILDRTYHLRRAQESLDRINLLTRSQNLTLTVVPTQPPEMTPEEKYDAEPKTGNTPGAANEKAG